MKAHPHLRNQFVHLMGPDGLRVSRLARVWWRGDRPSRVVTVTGDSLQVVGVVAPGEVFRTKRWILRVVSTSEVRRVRTKNHKMKIAA